jgi:tetratricopeptide (TPR) repeat protein
MTTSPGNFCPYKGLQPYTEADRKYFFGRERDQGIIVSNLYASSLTVFYGASGVGKSSVLLAGVVPGLREEPRTTVVVVFNSWQSEDFVSAVKAEVSQQAGTNVDPALPLDEFLAATQRAVAMPMFLVCDQFEEYFLYHPPSPSADAFEAEFARAVNRRDVKVNILLSLREDGLSKLDRFQGRIPSLLNNLLRLEHLDRNCAREAITKPLEEYSREQSSGQPAMSIEPAVVEAVLDDLSTVKVSSEQAGQGQVGERSQPGAVPIETPFLQVVMTRLWDEETAQGSDVLRLQTFEKLGRAENIARTHLDTVMSKLTETEHNDAAGILRYLVTPSGSKIAQEAAALVSWTDLGEGEVQAILTRLSAPDMRILRTIQTPGETTRYEIFHDVLAQAILNWRRRFVAAQQEEKIRREEQERRAEEQQEAERNRERESSRRIKMALIVLSIAFVVIVSSLGFGYWQMTKASKKQQEANAAAEREKLTAAQLDAERHKQDEAQKHANIAKAYLSSGRFDLAAAEYDKAVGLDADNPKLHNSKGYALLRAGKTAEAIETLKNLTALEPKYIWGHYNLCLAYWKAGKPQQAIAEAKKVIEIDDAFCKTFTQDANYSWFVKTPEYGTACKVPELTVPQQN